MLAFHLVFLISSVRTSSVAERAAELAQSQCVGVTDLASIDPAEADVLATFIGPTNYVESVGSFTVSMCACARYLDPIRHHMWGFDGVCHQIPICDD